MENKSAGADTVAIEVVILTVDHEIKGKVHVSKYTNVNRQLTELLNEEKRKFLAITDAEMLNRKGVGSPRRYNFIEIHMDYILMVHPSTQVLIRENTRAQDDVTRFQELRDKLSKSYKL